MYLFAQLAFYLFLTFLLGVGVGYTLWRAWGEREAVAKFNAAEMKLASHLARLENTARPAPQYVPPPQYMGGPDAKRANLEKRWEEAAKREMQEFEMKQAALMREAEDAAVRKAEAAAEKKIADLTSKYSYKFKGPETSASSTAKSADDAPRDPNVVPLVTPEASAPIPATVTPLRGTGD